MCATSSKGRRDFTWLGISLAVRVPHEGKVGAEGVQCRMRVVVAMALLGDEMSEMDGEITGDSVPDVHLHPRRSQG